MSSSLANLILYGDTDDLSNALKHLTVDDLNVIDEYGYTPLIETAIMDSQEKAALLLAAGADVNFPDLTRRTALHWTVDNNNVEFTELLLKHKANPNAYNSAGQPVLTMPFLRRQQAIKELLLKHGASLSFVQDFINAKLLAHRFLLQGRVDIVDPEKKLVEIDYEGFYLESSIAFLLNSLTDFANHFQARRIRPYLQEVKQIMTALKCTAELIKFQHYRTELSKHEKMIHLLLNQDLLIIPVGYEGHAITFVKYGGLLIRCDRGEYGRQYGTVIIYRIGNRRALTKAFLMNLMYKPITKEFITHTILQTLDLSVLLTLPLSAQVSGNCSWANAEASLLAGISLLLIEKEANMDKKTTDHVQKKAFFIFDEWMQWDRNRALDFCIDSFYDADDLRKLSKATMLTSIFIQQCQYENVEDLNRVKQIIPIITDKKYSYILKIYLDVFKQMQNKALVKKIEEYLDDFGINL
jgi:hypothetical protein